MRAQLFLRGVIASALASGSTLAQPEPPADATASSSAQPATPAESTVAPASPPVPVAPYSLPWQLRSVVPATVLRWDTSYGAYEDTAGAGGSTVVTTLLFSYKVTPEFAPFLRWGMAGDTPPASQAGLGGIAFTNPLLGAMYSLKMGDLRFGLFLGLALPFGSGGGDTPDKSAANTKTKGLWLRAAMDNALFAVNDVVVIPGLDLAYVRGGFTAQAEATLLFLERARGSAAQLEASKINMTTGLHVGYFVHPMLSLGAELRYQRWLNAPIAVETAENASNPTYAQQVTASQRDQASVGVGPRLHIQVGDLWLRPGISYTRGLDRPMAAPANYHVLQLDLPVVF